MKKNNDATFLMLVILAFAIWLLIVIALRAEPLHAQDVSFAQRVANRCTGEAAWAVPECACTVRNRLLNGWTEDNVLDAYYAEDVQASAVALWMTEYILRNGCREDLYFMFSNHDAVVLGLEYVLPVLTVRHPDADSRYTARFYAKDVFEKGD